MRKRQKKRTAKVPPQTAEKLKIQKPLAVLIKFREGQTFGKTLRAIKQVVNLTALGGAITKIMKTREGHLLFEMKGGPKAIMNVYTLTKVVVDKTGIITGLVSNDHKEFLQKKRKNLIQNIKKNQCLSKNNYSHLMLLVF